MEFEGKQGVDDGWIELGFGGKLYYNDPPEKMATQFTIKDVANSLSKLCRFNGHTRRFYSVAEHAMRLADLVYKERGSAMDALLMLHHDSAEFAVGDMPTPLKKMLPGFKEIENRVEEAIRIKFDLPEFPKWIKEYDLSLIHI